MDKYFFFTTLLVKIRKSNTDSKKFHKIVCIIMERRRRMRLLEEKKRHILQHTTLTRCYFDIKIPLRHPSSRSYCLDRSRRQDQVFWEEMFVWTMVRGGMANLHQIRSTIYHWCKYSKNNKVHIFIFCQIFAKIDEKPCQCKWMSCVAIEFWLPN